MDHWADGGSQTRICPRPYALTDLRTLTLTHSPKCSLAHPDALTHSFSRAHALTRSLAALVRSFVRAQDQYNTITDSLSSHIHLTHDVSHFLSERAALEREYAGKLSALTRKFKDKREKRVMECVVGSEPAKVWSQQVAERSTLQRYLHSAVTATEGVCNDHNALAGNYDSLAADVEAGAKKAEDMRKKVSA